MTTRHSVSVVVDNVDTDIHIMLDYNTQVSAYSLTTRTQAYAIHIMLDYKTQVSV